MRKLGLVVLLGAVLALVPGAAHGQLALGAQLSLGTDSDIGVGGRLLVGLEELVANMEGIGSFDWFFPDGDIDWWELNGNVVVPVTVTSGFAPYLGGGLNVTSRSFDAVDFPGDPDLADADDTEIGLNLVGGMKFPSGATTPFLELRATIAGSEQLVFTGGILFGRGN